MTTIGGVIPALLAWPARLNAKGTVAGIAGPGHVFLYSNGTLTDIGPPGTTPPTVPRSTMRIRPSPARRRRLPTRGAPIDSAVVAGSRLTDSRRRPRAGPRGITTRARSWAGAAFRPMIDHGFCRRRCNYDLNNLLLTNLQGREIVNAMAINDSGQIAANACNINHTNCVAVRLDPVPAGCRHGGGQSLRRHHRHRRHIRERHVDN